MFVNKIAYDPVKYVSDKDYMFLASMISSRLSNMINSKNLDQAITTGDTDMAARVIAEAGWPNMAGMSLEEIDVVLDKRLDSIYKDIELACPEDQIVQIMRAKYDYHNIKAIVKGVSAGADVDSVKGMLSTAGRVPVKTIREDYLNNDYSDLSMIMAEAMREARDLMARTQNPTAVDLYIDRMYFKEILELAEQVEPQTGSGIAENTVKDVVKQLIDCVNLRTCVRVVRLGKNQDFLKGVLIENGNYPVDKLAAAAFSGDGLAPMFKMQPYYKAAQIGQEVIDGTAPITVFEKACKEAHLRYLSDLRVMYMDGRAVIWYLTMIETNILNVRMVLAGLMAGVAPEKIKERLRQTYV